jgi:putative tryptophan/tyrosine transport system substrate-binding protein
MRKAPEMNEKGSAHGVCQTIGRVIALSATMFLVVPLSGCGRDQAPKAKVVILTPVPFDILDASIAGIKKGLAAEGYGPEKIELKEINAGGQMQMLAGYARQIIASHPDVIVPVSTPATEAVVAVAPSNQNVVFSTVTDPTKAKVPHAPSNITGVSDVVNYAANVSLLQELFPQAKRIGTIYNPGDDAAVFGLEHIKPLLASRGLRLTAVAASDSNEAVVAARSLVGNIDVLLIGSDSTAASAMPGISAVASRAKVPVIASDAGSVRNGALAAVSVDYEKLGVAGAHLIAQVLRSGKSAGQIPRIGFTGDTLILNTATADAMGYHFPPAVTARNPELVGAK